MYQSNTGDQTKTAGFFLSVMAYIVGVMYNTDFKSTMLINWSTA